MANTESAPAAAPLQPSLPWRAASSVIMGVTGTLSRAYLYVFNTTETPGLDKFLKLLDKRNDPTSRERGLITVSNHISVIDDPVVWGTLPFKYAFDPNNLRWTLGSADLCFTNKALSTFFSLGQVLPTHRSRWSVYGGPFQPTISQSIRLLSAQPFSIRDPHGVTTDPAPRPSIKPTSPDLLDPFSSGSLTYSTTGKDVIPAPSAFLSRRHAWIHIFPEGYIHQHPDNIMRYFRWGVSRLILEAEPMPDIVPIWLEGTQDCMHESRTFPRFVPRAGNNVKITFGAPVDGEKVFGPARRRWKELVRLQREALRKKGQNDELVLGELTEGLKHCSEAVEIRKEVTLLMRAEVMKIRQSLGYPAEDPKNGLVETWVQEGPTDEGEQDDGSWIKPA